MRIFSTPATIAAPAEHGFQRQHVAAFMTDASYEVTPAAADKIPDFACLLPAGTGVAITFLPGAPWRDSVRVAARLSREGMIPIPHVAARSLASIDDLRSFVRGLAEEAGATRALVIAGSVASPRGPLVSSRDVLRTGLLQHHGFERVYVAGHPEGSPDIGSAALEQALREKNELAEQSGLTVEIITQFCFDPATVIAWERRIRDAGNRLPIRVGLPGPATLKSLLAFGSACGVGASLTFLRRRAGDVAKLMAVTAPDRLVAVIARHVMNEPETRIAGAHIFPFGGLGRSAAWVRGVRDGRVTLTDDGLPGE